MAALIEMLKWLSAKMAYKRGNGAQ
jgi:hypothetical protein